MIIEVTEERALELTDKMGKFIAERRMASAAILFIESLKPLNFIGSQLLYFLHPFATIIFDRKAYEELAAMIETPEYVELLVRSIERHEEEIFRDEREQRALLRKQRKAKRRKFWNRIFKRHKMEE